MIRNIPLALVHHNPWQTRQGDPEKDYIRELADDIERNGLIQVPVGRIVALEDRRPLGELGNLEFAPEMPLEWPSWIESMNARMELAVGHNRLAAYKLLANHSPAGFGALPVDLRPLSDEAMAVLAWSENEKRRDVNPLERARAIEKRMQHFGWTQEQAGEHLGLSRSTVANILRLLKLPDELTQMIASGELSERQGLAMLPWYELDENFRQELLSKVNAWDSDNPKNFLKKIKAGQISSDEIRGIVNQLIGRLGNNLDEAKFGIDEDLAGEGINSARCRDCPKRIKARNICTDSQCHHLKTRLWERRYLEEASQASGYPILESDVDPNYVTDLNSWQISNNYADKMITANCENLRIVYQKRYSGDRCLNDLGYPDAQIVCRKRQGYCTCLKGLQAQAEMEKRQVFTAPLPMTPAEMDPDEQAGIAQAELEPQEPDPVPTPESLEQLARQARQEKRDLVKKTTNIREQFASRFCAALRQNNIAAWQELAGHINYKLKDLNGSVDAILQRIGEYIAEANEPYDPSSAFDVTAKLNGILAPMGQPPIDPSRLDGSGEDLPDDPPADLMLQFRQIQGWVQSLRSKVPAPAALAGVINILEEMEDLAASLEEQLPETIPDEISSLASQLREIERIITTEGWSDDGFYYLEMFLKRGPEDVGDYARHIPSDLVRYGLALIEPYQAYSEHSAILRRLLAEEERA